MININYPEPGFRIKKEQSKEFIFDALRKKWLLLTPEEWVRQNFVQYLIIEKKYPATIIAMEKEIQLGELKKRFDVVVYDSNHQPWMMIECKAAEIKLDDAVLQQILRYNISMPVPFIIITNGNLTYGWKKKGNDLHLIEELPDWE
jgi:hypothetical protein